MCLVHKREDGPCRVEHSGDHMETCNIKNCSMTQEPRIFCEESLAKNNAKVLELFWNRLVHEFYCLKVLINYFGTSGREKEESWMSKTSMNGADGMSNWSGTCCKLSLNISFSAMTEMTCQVHHFFALWQWCNFSCTRIYLQMYSINLETNCQIPYIK